MSDKAAPAPKKGGKLKKIIVTGGAALLLAGGGAGAGMYVGSHGAASEAKHEDPNRPKLVPKEGVDEHGAEAEAAHGGGGEAHPDPSLYKATYYPIPENFTSNLRDSDGFAQVALGVSTFYDEKVTQNLEDNAMPVRSAVLMTLADQDSFALATPEGKKRLQGLLKDAINAVLKEKTGFGGIDDVYFTSFIIQ